ncbi:hypothetical protein VDGL01_00398 [Verticillium dahliae]
MEAQKGAPAMSLLTDGTEADVLGFVIAIALFISTLSLPRTSAPPASPVLNFSASHTQTRWKWGGHSLAQTGKASARQVKRLPSLPKRGRRCSSPSAAPQPIWSRGRGRSRCIHGTCTGQ